MTVTEESGGRFNVFAKEPEIQLISKKTSTEVRSQLFLMAGVFILISIFGWFLINK